MRKFNAQAQGLEEGEAFLVKGGQSALIRSVLGHKLINNYNFSNPKEHELFQTNQTEW